MATIRIRVQVCVPLATDVEIRRLAHLSARVNELPPKQRRRVRRLLRAAFDELKLLEN